jgi:hypothetical protein
MFSEGWKSCLPLVTKSAQHCQLRPKLWLQRFRRNPTSASPTVTRAPKCAQCGREVPAQRGIELRGAGVPSKLSEENSDGPRPVRNGARQTSDIEVVSSVVTVLPPPRRTSMHYLEIPEHRTPHTPDSSGSRPTFAEIA